MELTPETDREIFITLNSEVKQLRLSIVEFGNKLMSFETTKYEDHEKRITKNEKWIAEWGGALKLIGILALLASIATFLFKHA